MEIPQKSPDSGTSNPTGNLLEESKVYELVESKNNAETFSKLYGAKIEQKTASAKLDKGYFKSVYKKSFSNEESGIDIGIYDTEQWNGNVNTGTASYNGYFINRKKEGTYSKGREWMYYGTFDKALHADVRISSVKNFKIQDNRILAEIEYQDGSSRVEDVGAFELPPVYAVYRDNNTYGSAQLLQTIKSLKGEHKIAENVENGIYKQGTEIEENEYINSIPDNAMVVADAAALKALPQLEKRGDKIIRIEDFLEGGSFADLTHYAKKINLHPSTIMIYKPGCADHVGPEGSALGIKNFEEDRYSEFLKEQFENAFNHTKVNVVITNDPNDLDTTYASRIYVVDRHRLDDKEDIKKSRTTLVLPASENEERFEKSGSTPKAEAKKYLSNKLESLESAK